VRPLACLLLAVAAVAVAGCGGAADSDGEKARKDVCDARADIGAQVDQLKGLTLATATPDRIRENVSAIQDDLRRIADAAGALSDERRAEVKAATDEFASRATEIARALTANLSLAEAMTRLRSAARDLGTAYADSLAKMNIDCGGS